MRFTECSRLSIQQECIGGFDSTKLVIQTRQMNPMNITCQIELAVRADAVKRGGSVADQGHIESQIRGHSDRSGHTMIRRQSNHNQISYSV